MIGCLLLLIVFLVPLTSCAKIDYSVVPPPADCVEEVPSPIEYIESNEVLERAYQMASMEWIPLNPVPKRGGGHYSAGVKVRGVPYSSVKEINTYLFQDVSYYTFMTAVHNPYSVLYTEDISKAPYHGKNCAPYYGAVCSSSVMWALGIDIPYYTKQIITLPEMMRLEQQEIDSLRICDVIWKPGHVQMIYNIEHRSDTVYKITTFETSGGSAHLSPYTKKQFRKMWDNGGYVGYRCNKIRYSQEYTVPKGFEPIEYNIDLCPSKGDRSVYRTTDMVTINIINPYYDCIKLTSGILNVVSDCKGVREYQYFNLGPGVYTVNLYKEEEESKTVSFEVVDTAISYSVVEKDKISVFFGSGSQPEYVALCDIHGASEYYRITSYDREQGYISLPITDPALNYCKVVFQGEYGRVSNEPLKIEL